MTSDRPPRALIFIVAYYAESTIMEVLRRIPALPGYETEVLIIDDCSGDATYALSDELRRETLDRIRLRPINKVNLVRPQPTPVRAAPVNCDPSTRKR